MFPRFVAGPIVRYKEMAIQFTQYGGMHVERGLSIFAVGLFYKCCFADSFEVFVPYAHSSTAAPEFFASWIGSFAYMMQIYFDFSGYSLMAIGLGWCLGFKFPENFKTPYLATSLNDFWRRWHISLSTWLRDYLYIPLGGNRGGKIAMYRNLMITMALGGLWHGASWNYVIWGLWHGLWLCLEKQISIPKKVGNLFTLWLVLIGLVFFRSTTLTESGRIINSMLNPYAFSLLFNPTALVLHPIAFFFSVLGTLYCFKLEPIFSLKGWMEKPEIDWSTRFAATAMLACSIVLVLSHNPVPFIYYQF
jgi:alginate O-acetyltransferase complex protein AlgI